ncbi:MAG: hypothetical protein NC206_11315 [Bacteroides sp.]|nr:hypothetical protein [Roseburia sp.]MCM1347656.1 hypothetical protein [Bacteroides sp.]MCM1422059.1 hypothetical protein [Bacteroides sp.]
MKLNKIFLLIGMALAGTLASCDDDDDYTAGPQATGQGVSFGTVSCDADETYLPTDETVLKIAVYRKDTKAAADIPVIVNLNDSIEGSAVFDIPGTVHFNAGEETAELAVRFPDATLGTSYTFEIEIPEEYKNVYATNLLRRHIMRDYEWISYEGILTTDFDGIDSDVIIQKANGFPIWRVVDPFADYWDAYYGEDTEIDYSVVAQYINFTIDEDGSVKFDTFLNDAYDEESFIYAFWPLDLNAGLTEEAAMSRLVDSQTVELYPYYYVPGLGGWGTYNVTIYLHEDEGSFAEE